MTTEDYRKECADTIDKLFSLLNSYSNRAVADELVEHLRTEHRTLQQSFWRMVQRVADEYKPPVFGSDGRNEQAVLFAKRISEINVPLPLI